MWLDLGDFFVGNDESGHIPEWLSDWWIPILHMDEDEDHDISAVKVFLVPRLIFPEVDLSYPKVQGSSSSSLLAGSSTLEQRVQKPCRWFVWELYSTNRYFWRLHLGEYHNSSGNPVPNQLQSGWGTPRCSVALFLWLNSMVSSTRNYRMFFLGFRHVHINGGQYPVIPLPFQTKHHHFMIPMMWKTAPWFLRGCSILQGGAPPVISWSLHHSIDSIDISTINHKP